MIKEPLPPFETLRPLLEAALGEPQPAFSEIEGGASTRRFFRVRAQNGQRAVAMYVPPASQEHSRAKETGRPWPFLEVRELLAARSIRVPGLLGAACSDGWLLLEDLGETIAQHLQHSPRDKTELYRCAVRDLAHAQRSLALLPEGSVIAERAFDETLLNWEIDHFREWALEARGIALDSAEQRAFARASAYLANKIAAWPRGFVHRDYQSRNLMVLPRVDGALGLGWIDFQDAMLGPRAYDLVALLGDSYQTFEPSFIEERLAEFCAELGLSQESAGTLRNEFDLVTVQRKLKDAGRFVFFQHKNHNPSFLQFVEPTIAVARAALARVSSDPELARFAELLDRLLSRSDQRRAR